MKLQENDPGELCKKGTRRLSQRVYHCHVPNKYWHVDGYDKLSLLACSFMGILMGFPEC